MYEVKQVPKTVTYSPRGKRIVTRFVVMDGERSYNFADRDNAEALCLTLNESRPVEIGRIN